MAFAAVIEPLVAVRSLIALVTVLPAVALLLSKRDRPCQAVALYELTRRQPHVAASHWFREIVAAQLRASSEVPTAASAPPSAAPDLAELWEQAEALKQAL